MIPAAAGVKRRHIDTSDVDVIRACPDGKWIRGVPVWVDSYDASRIRAEALVTHGENVCGGKIGRIRATSYTTLRVELPRFPGWYWIRKRPFWADLSELMLYWLCVPAITSGLELHFLAGQGHSPAMHYA